LEGRESKQGKNKWYPLEKAKEGHEKGTKKSYERKPQKSRTKGELRTVTIGTQRDLRQEETSNTVSGERTRKRGKQ